MHGMDQKEMALFGYVVRLNLVSVIGSRFVVCSRHCLNQTALRVRSEAFMPLM